MDSRTFAALCLLLGVAACAPPGGYPLKRTEYWFDVPLDHFASGGSSQTFQIRYLANAEYWDPMSGPIFFYAGNEGKVEGFYDNSGFLTDVLSPQFKALIVFGEHRYFGKSFPFDKNISFDADHNKWLTVDQAMMDYNLLIKEIRYLYGATDKPCIVFGGSYGGMLASWLRMKYPQTFQGAYASSAPILYFKDAGFPESAFGDIITNSYKAVDPKCPQIIKEGWGYLMDIKSQPENYDALSTVFNTCTKITNTTDIDNLYNHLMNGYSYMAMTDYPYPTSFLQPMPANPVNVACDAFKDLPAPTSSADETQAANGLTDRQQKVFAAILDSTNVYFNYKQQVNCTDFNDVDATGNLDGAGWNVLACNQLAMPTTNGKDSMFINNDPFNYDDYTKMCQQKYGLTPRYYWVWDYFGGQNIQRDFQAHTNIVFTNGNLDPWSAGGVLSDIQGNTKIKVIKMDGAAHHLELRTPNDADPPQVVQARKDISDLIKSWCDEYFTPPQLFVQ